MAYIPGQLQNKESILNKTITPLNDGQTYTGTWELCSGYSSVVSYINSDTANVFYLDFSSDQSNVDSSIPFSSDANINDVHRITITRPYVRLRVVNSSGGNQTFLRAGLMFGDHNPLTLGLNAPTIQSDWDSLVVRAVGVGQKPDLSYTNEKTDGVAASTLTPLSASATWYSGVQNTLGYSQIETQLYSDKAGVLVGKWYTDSNKTTLIRTFTRPYANDEVGQTSYFSSPVFGTYLEYEYTNGSEAQTKFDLELIFRTQAISGQLLGVNDFIPNGVIANLGRSILVGQDTTGNFKNVPVDAEGNMKVQVAGPLTAFGALQSEELTPVIQMAFPYNINTELITTSSFGSATLFVSQSLLHTNTGNTTNSSGSFRTKRSIKYRPGQGITARFTAYADTSSVSNSFVCVGIGTETDGYFFATSGSVFGVKRIQNGTQFFTPSSEWNIDKLTGNGGLDNPSGKRLDVGFGNPLSIQYQWLGYGAIVFKVEDQDSGELVPVHRIRYANQYKLPSTFNPTLPFSGWVYNGSGTDNVSLKIASIGVFNEGRIVINGPTNSYSRAIPSASGNVHVFTIRNKSTINSVINRDRIILALVALVADGNATAKFKFIQNGTFTGQVWSNISANSIVEVSTAGTYTASSGKILFAIGMGKVDSRFEKLSELQYQLAPGETLSVILESSGVNAGTDATLSWVEDL